MSNTAGELGYVVLIPLAAMLFHSLGRHPLAGLAAAFAGVSGGYSANLLIGTVDPLLSGITETAARILDPEYIVGPEVNWYFMAVSTFFIAIAGAWVTEKLLSLNWVSTMWLKRVMTYHKIKWAFDRCGKERLKIRWIRHRRCLRTVGLDDCTGKWRIASP